MNTYRFLIATDARCYGGRVWREIWQQATSHIDARNQLAAIHGRDRVRLLSITPVAV